MTLLHKVHDKFPYTVKANLLQVENVEISAAGLSPDVEVIEARLLQINRVNFLLH